MSGGSEEIRREDRRNGGRYVRHFADGSEAEMIYVADDADTAIITHTYTPPRHRGHGVAAELIARAVEDFRKEGRKVVPSCWFARQEFSAHPEWSDVLDARARS